MTTIGLVAALILMPGPSHAAPEEIAKCDAPPRVGWWISSHRGIERMVAKRYDGDWKNYIKRWRQYAADMRDAYNNGQAAVVRSHGVRIEGEDLIAYIAKIEQRVDVLECLRDIQAAYGHSEISNLETAAAGNRKTPQTEPAFGKSSAAKRMTVSQAVREHLDVEVSARCEKNTVVFQVTNLGEQWPRLGEINVYRVSQRALVSKRRIRLANSQQATFLVRDAGNDAGGFGIWLAPSWFDRGFRYDATIRC
ncbi:MAG: hypothetical protein QGH73_12630 [Rhodospirillales bacterium]|jgi:hypothetical protein|nr:hypothetical protein [Rhodospirillales bacterium]MDP6645700.1 hypothetical protein [Rhodospirillales bacterium]MDP6842516.1 hypothetical protein [Rhodospirillales bacterium]|tara:strand:+ start:704 stop:1456 length:753 start_codon:yes stop_codon:yes gene_type:complete